MLREDWTRDQRSTFLGLLAWFNQRRQRDGCEGRSACEAPIPPGDLLTITLTDSLEDARELLRDVADELHISIEARGRFTFVRWPKLLDFQEWQRPAAARRVPDRRPAAARSSPGRCPANAPSDSDSDSDSVTVSDSEEEHHAPRGVDRLSGKRLEPPEVAGLGLETLPTATAKKLLRVHPGGVQRTPEDLACWFAMQAPRMRARQIRSPVRAASNWWPRVRREEIEEAHRWVSMRRLESQREEIERSASGDPPPLASEDLAIESWS